MAHTWDISGRKDATHTDDGPVLPQLWGRRHVQPLPSLERRLGGDQPRNRQVPGAHLHANVEARLEKHPRVRLHFTPTSLYSGHSLKQGMA